MMMMMMSGAINVLGGEKRRVFGVWWWLCFGVNGLFLWSEWTLKGVCEYCDDIKNKQN